MNYTKKCNIFCHFLEISLHYCVKHNSLKCCNYFTDSWRQSCAELLW